MSAILVGLAKKAHVGDTTAKLTLLVLADYANEDGMAWPSVSCLTREVEKGERSIQRALRHLEQLGLITRGDQSFAARYRSDRRPVVYQILPNVNNSASNVDNSVENSNGVTSTTPREGNGVTSVTSRGVTGDASRGDMGDTQTINKEPLNNQVLNTSFLLLNNESNAREKTTTTKHTISDDWQPSTLALRECQQLGLTPAKELASFINYHQQHETLSHNWEALFIGWCRKNPKAASARRQPPTAPHSPHKHTIVCPHVKAALKNKQLNTERSGFAPSQHMQVAQKVADLMNQGTPAPTAVHLALTN